MGRSARLIAASLAWLALSAPPAPVVTVRHREGTLHGFLGLSTLEGTAVAAGDLIQTASDDRVTARLVFRFNDGSVSDETTVFSQRGHFRLISDHLVQRGPSFPTPIDLSIDPASGLVSVAYSDPHGRPQTIRRRMDVPEDVANGLIPTLLKNVDPKGSATSVSMIAATPQPRLVHLTLTPSGVNQFSIAGISHAAQAFVVHVDLGGITGAIARLLGKQPPDSRVWILEGEAPAFVRSEQPLYAGGPLWRIELVSPRWPGQAARAARPDEAPTLGRPGRQSVGLLLQVAKR